MNGDAGYRTGINMKAYQDKKPLMIIGGKAGSFLGEYQAGGVIIVLNLFTPQEKIVGYFPGTGMHGGKMFLRSECRDIVFPKQVVVRSADEADKKELRSYLVEFCDIFGYDIEYILSHHFTVLTPDTNNPYRQLYVAN